MVGEESDGGSAVADDDFGEFFFGSDFGGRRRCGVLVAPADSKGLTSC